MKDFIKKKRTRVLNEINVQRLNEIESSIRQITGVVAVSFDFESQVPSIDLIVTPGNLLQFALSEVESVLKRNIDFNVKVAGVGIPPSKESVKSVGREKAELIHLVAGVELTSGDPGRVNLTLEFYGQKVTGEGPRNITGGPALAVIDAVSKLSSNNANVDIAAIELGDVSVVTDISHSAKVSIKHGDKILVGVARSASIEEAVVLAAVHAVARAF